MDKIPTHVGIIMDGNGRWATKRGLIRTEGHRKGAETLEELVNHAFDLGIDYLSVYAFSTDNFNRPEQEVTFLMDLFVKLLKTRLKKIIERGAKVVISGRRENLREDVLDAIDYITEKTKDNSNGVLNICINYGSQEEIVDATKKIVEDVISGKINITELDKKNYYNYLYNDLPPLDLVIRTSGELRLSNFMLYQSSYSEFYFPETLFPDFSNDEFDKAIESFSNRDRRFGKIKVGSEKNEKMCNYIQ